MLRETGAILLVATILAGCSAASGPTFSAASVTFPNGEKAFRVQCFGIFEGASTCQKKAQDICGNQPVRPLERVGTLASTSDGQSETRILTFQCGVPAQPVVVPPPPLPPQPVAPPQKITLNGDANFDTAQSSLTPLAQRRLDKLSADARGMTFGTVTVKGYTDSVGSDAYNQDLSARRAETVAQYLEEHGLRAQRFTAHGYGKSDPVASNDTAAGRAQNRRVEIELDQN